MEQTNNKIRQEALFDVVWKMVNSKAGSNAFIQGISGVAGFPATLAIDTVVILTHYEPMINDIRRIYGRNVLTSAEVKPMLGSLMKEILVDLAVDKVMGQLPVAGVYFNAIAAKALTWRLGMLTAIISARGDEFTKTNLYDVLKLVRYITPQSDMFKFTKPDYDIFKKIVLSVDGNDVTTFEDKIKTALGAFE